MKASNKLAESAKDQRQYFKEDPFASTTYTAFFKPATNEQKQSITVEKTLKAAKG